jgi:hypothetical protein
MVSVLAPLSHLPRVLTEPIWIPLLSAYLPALTPLHKLDMSRVSKYLAEERYRLWRTFWLWIASRASFTTLDFT